TARYIMINYNTIADSSVVLTDADLKKAYNENIKRYEQPEETRKLDYVVFDVTPSDNDRAEIEKSVQELMTSFKETTDDSLFVAQNSDGPVDNAYHKQGT